MSPTWITTSGLPSKRIFLVILSSSDEGIKLLVPGVSITVKVELGFDPIFEYPFVISTVVPG